MSANSGTWQFMVTLTCGHQLTLKQEPLNKKAKFGCPNRPRCGYFMRWVSVRDTRTNHITYNDTI